MFPLIESSVNGDAVDLSFLTVLEDDTGQLLAQFCHYIAAYHSRVSKLSIKCKWIFVYIFLHSLFNFFVCVLVELILGELYFNQAHSYLLLNTHHM